MTLYCCSCGKPFAEEEIKGAHEAVEEAFRRPLRDAAYPLGMSSVAMLEAHGITTWRDLRTYPDLLEVHGVGPVTKGHLEDALEHYAEDALYNYAGATTEPTMPEYERTIVQGFDHA